MTKPHVQVNPQYCTMCRTCELVCSGRYLGNGVNPKVSRIRVESDKRENKNTPKVCFQCEDAFCMQACPTKPEKAIRIDPDLGIPVVNKELCIGCTLCVQSCPYGLMFFDETQKKALKCDLCGGKPQCVENCWMRALSYIEKE